MVNHWVLSGLHTGVWGGGYLEEQKWLQSSCITKWKRGLHASASHPEFLEQPEWVTVHRSWKPGVHCTAYGQLNRLESALSKWLWSNLTLPGSSPGFCFSKHLASLKVFAAWLFWESSSKLALAQLREALSFYWLLVNLVGFRDFLKLFLVVYLLV